MRARLPLPKAIQNAPDLPFGLELFYGAFLDLSLCRPAGWGVQPIPWLTIHEYAEAHGFDQETRDDLFFFVRSLDRAFCDYHAKQSQPSGKSAKKT